MQEATSSTSGSLPQAPKDVSASREAELKIELQETVSERDGYDKASSASSGIPDMMPNYHELQPISLTGEPSESQLDEEPHRSRVRVIAIMVALSVSLNF